MSADSLAKSKLYDVSKVQLFFEYLTETGVVVTRSGFVNKEEKSNRLTFIDGVEPLELVKRRTADTLSNSKTLFCDDLVPDRLFYLPSTSEKGDKEWRHDVDFVREIFSSNSLRRAIAVRLEPDADFRRTRVQFYWRIWTNRNSLSKNFVHWFVENAESRHLKQLRRAARKHAENGGGDAEISAAADSRTTLAVARFAVKAETVRTAAAEAAEAAAEKDRNDDNVQRQQHSDTAIDDDDDDDNDDRFTLDEAVNSNGSNSGSNSSSGGSGGSGGSSNSSSHHTWLKNLTMRDWDNSVAEHYLFTIDACAFGAAKHALKKRAKKERLVSARGVAQADGRPVFRLERHLYNGRKQFLLCDFLKRVAKHLQRCILIDSAIAPTFAPLRDTDRSLLDEQQKQCARFLRLRQINALRSDGTIAIRRLTTIEIADSGWRYMCEQNRLEHDMSSGDSANENNCRRREKAAACLLCIKSLTTDSRELYDTPNALAGHGWLKWQETRQPSVADRFTLLGGAPRTGKHVVVLHHILNDCERRRGLFHTSMLARRSVDDASAYQYLSSRFKTSGVSLQTMFEMMERQGNDECNVAAAESSANCRRWSQLSSMASLIVCNEYDVWRWLMALSTLNERQHVYVGQSGAESNVFHVTRPCSGFVRMRMHVIRTVQEYHSFSFASLLTADVVVVTTQLLAQLVPENCSYLSGFRFDESVAAFDTDSWMECVRHQMNATQRISVARLCSRSAAPQHVPLEAIFWRCIVYDSPPTHFGAAPRTTARFISTERKLASLAFEAFSQVAQAAHTIALEANTVPSIGSCHRQWRQCLLGNDGALPKDFLLRCSRRFERRAPHIGHLPRCWQTTIYVQPQQRHLALLQTVFDLQCQLQDMQALVCQHSVYVDGAFQDLVDEQYPRTVCDRLEHLKASFRYALHFCEQNWRVAPIVIRNLSRQILQRSARFLSQNNIDFSTAEYDPQIVDNENGSEHMQAALASDAFHAMVRYRHRQQTRDAASQTASAQAGDMQAADAAPATPMERSADDSDYQPESDDDESSSIVFDLSDDDDDDDDVEEDSDSDSDESELEEGLIGNGDRLFLGSLIVSLGDDNAAATATAAGRSSAESTDRALWDSNIESRMATALDADTDRYDFVNSQASLYSAIQSDKSRAYLEEFDTETCIGWSRSLDRRMLLQRSEYLSANCKLPYTICATSVADRQLVSFVNLLANSKRIRLDDSRSPITHQNTDESAALTPPHSPHDLNDYEKYYAMLEPATLTEMTEQTMRDVTRADDAEPPPLPLPTDEPLSAAQLQDNPSLALSTLVSASSAGLEDARTRANAQSVLAQTCKTGDELVQSWSDAIALIERNRAKLEQHYELTRQALAVEKSASERLLCTQIRILVLELLGHPQQPIKQSLVAQQPLVNACVNQSGALPSFDNSEQCSATAEAMYDFYAESVRPVLAAEAMRNYRPTLSPNLSYLCEQTSKLRRNTRWLSVDLDFVEKQLNRLDQSRSSAQQTLSQVRKLSAANSVHAMMADDRGECAICLESSVGKDVALFACGHWCCWECYCDGGKKRYRIEDDDEPYVGASQSGHRCACCRYVLQRFESVQRVSQSHGAAESTVGGEQAVANEQQQQEQEERQQEGQQQEQQERQQAEMHTDVADQQSLSLSIDGDETESVLPDAKRKRSVQDDAVSTPDKRETGAVAADVPSAFVKCETILAWIQQQCSAGAAPLRCAVLSQYAVQLRELYTLVLEWIEKQHITNVCVLYCPTPEQVIERQSSEFVKYEQSLAAVQTNEVGVAGGSVASGSGGKRKRHSDSALAAPTLFERNIVVLQHLDVTRNLRSHEHAEMQRVMPPIRALSHVVFCESLCLRMQKSDEALERTLQLESHLLAQKSGCRAVQVVRFIETGGVDEYLHDTLNLLEAEQKRDSTLTPQYMRDVTLVLDEQ